MPPVSTLPLIPLTISVSARYFHRRALHGPGAALQSSSPAGGRAAGLQGVPARAAIHQDARTSDFYGPFFFPAPIVFYLQVHIDGCIVQLEIGRRKPREYQLAG